MERNYEYNKYEPISGEGKVGDYNVDLSLFKAAKWAEVLTFGSEAERWNLADWQIERNPDSNIQRFGWEHYTGYTEDPREVDSILTQSIDKIGLDRFYAYRTLTILSGRIRIGGCIFESSYGNPTTAIVGAVNLRTTFIGASIQSAPQNIRMINTSTGHTKSEFENMFNNIVSVAYVEEQGKRTAFPFMEGDRNIPLL